MVGYYGNNYPAVYESDVQGTLDLLMRDETGTFSLLFSPFFNVLFACVSVVLRAVIAEEKRGPESPRPEQGDGPMTAHDDAKRFTRIDF